MTWERYYPSSSQVSDEPRLSIHVSGDGRLNAAADREWFLDADEVVLHLDVERGLLAVEPLGDDESGAGPTLTLQREAQKHGADINTRGAMVDLGADIEALDSATRLPLDWDGDRGFAVADVSALLDGVQEGAPDDDSAGETDLPEWFIDELRHADGHGTREKLRLLLDRLTDDGPIERPASEIGAPIGLSGSEVAHNIRHIGDGFRVEKRDPPTDAAASLWYVERVEGISDSGDETEDSATAEADGGAVADVGADDTVQIREAAEHCESLQDLADRFDVDVERARGLAMSAGVYSQLRDDVDRPGVDRDA